MHLQVGCQKRGVVSAAIRNNNDLILSPLSIVSVVACLRPPKFMRQARRSYRSMEGYGLPRSRARFSAFSSTLTLSNIVDNKIMPVR